MSRSKRIPASLLGLFSACCLVACGGGGGGDGTPPPPSPPPPPASSVTITGKAVDGALQGAKACYDLNDNGACESTEPTFNPTDASGAFQLAVQASDAGKHRVVVEVPATAIDADTGAAVGTAFTLQSPATGTTVAHSVFASPLSTLVQAQMDRSGLTLTAATELVKAQASLTLSPLEDFTTGSSADQIQTRKLARLVQLTSLQQSSTLATIAGQVDLSGATITATDVAQQATGAVIDALPVIAAKALEPAIANATGSALQTALLSAAQAVVAQAGMTPEEAKASVGVGRLPVDTSTGTPAPSASLTALRYTDANNWYYRALESSTADNTPDANNVVRYYEVHQVSESSGFSPNGVAYGWAYNNTHARAGDLHWDGSAWVACSLGDRYTSTKRDAQGRSTYSYCKNGEIGSSTRSLVDLTGQNIASVFTNRIRTFPGSASGVAYAVWGPADLGLFGNATFPAGSKLIYQSNSITGTAFFFDPSSTGAVTVYSAAIAAGGDARSTPSLACAVNPTPAPNAATTLEALVATNPGQPCVFAKSVSGADSTLDPNEWWSNSTVSLGVLAGAVAQPQGTGNYYSTDLRLRVAFAPTGHATRYYSCFTRASTGSSRNCTQIGSGTYAIETLGDARVMSFTGLPAITQRTGFTRVFVERGGQVWFGYKNPSGVTNAVLRLNIEATNAVFSALPGLPPVRPVTQPSDMSAASQTALATMKGVWGEASDTDAIVFRFGDGGRFLMGQAGPENLLTREQTGAELGWFDYDAATQKFRSLLEVDSNMTAGTSHPNAADQTTTMAVSASQLALSNGRVFSRLSGGTSGLVGLWALGSATDLKTQHFAFFPNGKVLMMDPLGDTSNGACTAARQGPPGGEFASYTFDAATGALRVFGKVYDTNGCAGLFDSSQGAVNAGTANTEANLTVTISGDGKSATVINGVDSVTLYRVAIQ